MHNRIWYNFTCPKFYDLVDGLIVVNGANCSLFEKEVQDTIDLFNSDIDWDDMWDLDLAYERFEEGSTLFLLRDLKGALGHIWNNGGVFFNVYVNPRRSKGISERFFNSCLLLSGEESIDLWTDEWNKKAQRFFEKVGGTKDSSYI